MANLATAKQTRESEVDNWTAVLEAAVTAEAATGADASSTAELTEWFATVSLAQKAAFTAHTTYTALETNRETRKETITEFNDLNKKYLKLRAKLRPKIDTALVNQLMDVSPPASTIATTSSVQPPNFGDLPKLVIPPFDGNFLGFQTWKKLFMTTIAPFASMPETRKAAMLNQALHESVRDRLDFDADATYTAMMATLDKYYGSSYRLAQEMLVALQNAPKVTPGKLNEFQRITNLTRSIKKAVVAFNGTNLGEMLVLSLLEAKLPDEKRHQFKLLYATATAGGVVDPSLAQFVEYMENISINHGTQRTVGKRFGVHAMQPIQEEDEEQGEAVGAHSIQPQLAPPVSTFPSFPVANTPTFASGGNRQPIGQRQIQSRSDRSVSCAACGSPHPVYQCKQFLNMRQEQRWKLANESSLCYNCLFPGHSASTCGSSQTCKTCSGTHHTFLHQDQANRSAAAFRPNNSAATGGGDRPPSSNAVGLRSASLTSSPFSKMMLMTAKLRFYNTQGVSKYFRAFIDPGAEASLAAERLVDWLGVEIDEALTVALHFVAGAGVDAQPLGRVKITAESLITGFKFSEKCLVLPTVTKSHVMQQLPAYLQGVDLADDFSLGEPIDLLLSADVFRKLILQKRIDPPLGTVGPTAFQTKIGYVLAGSLQPEPTTTRSLAAKVFTTNRVQIDQLEKFWEVEEVPRVSGATMSAADRVVQDHFDRTVKPGKPYEVSICFDPRKLSALGATFNSAMKRYLNMERKLKLGGHFDAYQTQIGDFVESGHAEAVPEEDVKNPKLHYFLPHRPVVKESSTTTRVRPVFDAGHPSTSGLSLNDTIRSCPNNTPDLVNIVIRWKWYQFIAIADASKMYRMIVLDSSLRDLHRFLWRPSPEQPVRQFRMKRLTWGTKPAAFLAIEAMKHNANRFANQFPAAARAIAGDSFVDDIIMGADTLDGLAQLCDDVTEVMQRGGFALAKWLSPHSEILARVPTELLDSNALDGRAGNRLGLVQRLVRLQTSIRTRSQHFHKAEHARPHRCHFRPHGTFCTSDFSSQVGVSATVDEERRWMGH